MQHPVLGLEVRNPAATCAESRHMFQAGFRTSSPSTGVLHRGAAYRWVLAAAWACGTRGLSLCAIKVLRARVLGFDTVEFQRMNAVEPLQIAVGNLPVS